MHRILTFWKIQDQKLGIARVIDLLKKSELFWYYTTRASQLIYD